MLEKLHALPRLEGSSLDVPLKTQDYHTIIRMFNNEKEECTNIA